MNPGFHVFVGVEQYLSHWPVTGESGDCGPLEELAPRFDFVGPGDQIDGLHPFVRPSHPARRLNLCSEVASDMPGEGIREDGGLEARDGPVRWRQLQRPCPSLGGGRPDSPQGLDTTRVDGSDQIG
jgi:hypothetical protein